MKDIIKSNLNSIHTRIHNACARAKRNPKDIQRLLATKTVNAERIKLALDCGESLIAENTNPLSVKTRGFFISKI